MLNWLIKNEKKILWLSIILYFLIFSLICIWKYFQFGYNGLDLAIYNQVFFNSSEGRLFEFSIHPQSYLGDHFEIFILFLLPLYAVFKHPISLLIIQSLALAISAWPLYLISKRLLPSFWPLFIALAWLLNPFIQNINLFEFHLLPFAIPLLLFAFYFYQENNFFAFLLFAFCSLLVREDVALVVFMFGILAAVDRRPLKWIIWPLVLASAWFVLAVKVIGHFSPGGNYKFLYYYYWLGSSVKEMAFNTLAHPWLVLKHVLSLNNILFTLMLLMPFAYLNLLKLRYLLLAALIYLQILLGGSANSTVVLKIHYVSLFLPPLFISLIYGLKRLLDSGPSNKLVNSLKKNLTLVILILMAATLYSSVTLGPVPATAKALFKAADSQEVKQIKAELIKALPPQQSLATTYDFLTSLSSREKVYGLNYAFVGKKQFTDLDYELPNDLEGMVMDSADLITFGLQFPGDNIWQKNVLLGDDRLRKIIDRGMRAIKVIDSYIVFEKSNDPGLILYQTQAKIDEIQNLQTIKLGDEINFLGWSKILGQGPTSLWLENSKLLPISLYFASQKKLDKNFQLKLSFKDKQEKVLYQKYYALGYGLYPTTEWQPGEIVKINYWFLIPKNLSSTNYQIELQLVDLKGFITLDGLRSVVPQITKEVPLGQAIIIK